MQVAVRFCQINKSKVVKTNILSDVVGENQFKYARELNCYHKIENNREKYSVEIKG